MYVLKPTSLYVRNNVIIINLLKPTCHVMHKKLNLLNPTGYVMHQQFNLLKPTGHVTHQQLIL
jgi:hypothetical protein